jgi:hypothetical protein
MPHRAGMTASTAPRSPLHQGAHDPRQDRGLLGEPIRWPIASPRLQPVAHPQPLQAVADRGERRRDLGVARPRRVKCQRAPGVAPHALARRVSRITSTAKARNVQNDGHHGALRQRGPSRVTALLEPHEDIEPELGRRPDDQRQRLHIAEIEIQTEEGHDLSPASGIVSLRDCVLHSRERRLTTHPCNIPASPTRSST